VTLFAQTRLRGSSLPQKTLCLTYDDGPGPETEELGRSLFAQGIPATFFVIGERAAASPAGAATLDRLIQWGHLVANHTATHPRLPTLLPDGEAVVREVWDGHTALGPAADGAPLLLRPPYGAWSAEVAEALAADGRTRRYTGPVLWDVDGRDWQLWREGASVEAVADRYFAAIEQGERGIVLLHDGAAEEERAALYRPSAMTRRLVPRLLAAGYRFVRLDAVPEIRSALSAGEGLAP
jgi:peptidoglycan/xylan/chitin deacetylase (PgdA/CDA1 family)